MSYRLCSAQVTFEHFAFSHFRPHGVVSQRASLGAFLTFCTLDGPHHAARRIPRPHVPPACTLEKDRILLTRPLPTGAPAHHVDVEQLGKMWRTGVWYYMLDDKDPAPWRSRSVDVVENL